MTPSLHFTRRCSKNAGVTWANKNQAANVNDHASILKQLTTTIFAQNKEAIKPNNLRCNEISAKSVKRSPRRIEPKRFTQA
jgi:hypothetical protein